MATTPNGGTFAYDLGKDAKMFDVHGNDAYWLVDNEEERYVITSVPVVSNDLSLDIGVCVDSEKEIIFTLDGTESFTNEIYLLDKEIKVVTDIRESNYTTTLSNGDNTGRFSLVFKEDAILDSEEINADNKLTIVVDENNIYIILKQGVVKNVKLYDLTGKTIIDYNSPTTSSNVNLNTKGYKNKLGIIKIKILVKEHLLRKFFLSKFTLVIENINEKTPYLFYSHTFNSRYILNLWL